MLRWSELRQLKQGLVWRERIMCLGRTSSGKRIARPTTTLQGLSFRNRSSLRFPVRFRWRLRIEVRGEARPDFCFPGNPSTLDTAEQRWGAARAARDQATAEASLTRLDVAIATVNAYLTVLAAQRTTRAADADVQRRDTFDKAVRVLVENQLRAGADSSRADAELARARVNLARAQQQEKISRAALADILGLPDTSVAVVEGSLLEPPPGEALQTTPITNNPVAEVQHARVEDHAQVHILDRSCYPKLYLQSSVYGRGSGWDPTGKFEGGTTGLAPDRSNWAVGLTVTLPAFDIFAIRSRKAVESANERAEAARYDQTLQDLTGQLRKAQASLEGARFTERAFFVSASIIQTIS